MSHSFEELKQKTVAELRAIAKEVEHDAVSGYSSMPKKDLLQAVCTALGVDAHEHREGVDIDKRAIKAQIRQLKSARDAALQARDREQLSRVRRRIHRLKRRMRAAAV